jgi:hypothetical protein
MDECKNRFEKWYDSRYNPLSPVCVGSPKSEKWEAWQSRQPEIDALKAENEKLRKDAEKGMSEFTVAYFLLRDLQQMYVLSPVAEDQIAKFQLAIIKLQTSAMTAPVYEEITPDEYARKWKDGELRQPPPDTKGE